MKFDILYDKLINEDFFNKDTTEATLQNALDAVGGGEVKKEAKGELKTLDSVMPAINLYNKCNDAQRKNLISIITKWMN